MHTVEACQLRPYGQQQGRGAARSAAAALLLALALRSGQLSAAAPPVISPDVPLVGCPHAMPHGDMRAAWVRVLKDRQPALILA